MNKTYPKSNYKEIRSQLKTSYKSLITEHTKNKRSGTYSSSVNYSSYSKVRIAHIAYSMFKGHTFEQVESKWKDPHSGTNAYIKREALKLYESYMKRIVVAEDALEVTI